MNLAVSVVLLPCLLCEVASFNYNKKQKYVSVRPYYESRPSYYFSDQLRNEPKDWYHSTFNMNDRLNFHYPNVEFLTKIDRKYTVINPEKAEDDSIFMNNQNLEPSTQMNNYYHKNRVKIDRVNKYNITYQPVQLSYPQEVTKAEQNISSTDSIPSESVELEEAKNTTQNNIHNFLKSYLVKLYSKLYNSSDSISTFIKPSSYSKLTDLETVEENTDVPEHKFIGGVFKKLKDKAINKSKMFSLFTIVQFNNTQCNATSNATGMSYIGVCYTLAECNNILGTSVGNCANGYGVCCVGKYGGKCIIIFIQALFYNVLLSFFCFFFL